MFGPAWLAYGHSFTVENDGQAMAAYFKASQLMACFKEFGSVSDARFLEMGRRPSRGWRCPCPHPKLTAKQKQHILDRSSVLASFGQLTEQLLGRCMMGAGHSRPGGSVPSGSSCSRRAPRPSAWSPCRWGAILSDCSLKLNCTIYFPCSQVRVPQRREPQLSGMVITPRKPSLETASSRAQAQQQVITQ